MESALFEAAVTRAPTNGTEWPDEPGTGPLNTFRRAVFCALAIVLTVLATIIGCWCFRRRVFTKPIDNRPMTDGYQVNGKVVIVTGANSGVGKATAEWFAARGAVVYLACRDAHRGRYAQVDIIRATNSRTVFLHIVDLASLESIRRFAREFKFKESRLDILINNAGTMGPKQSTVDGNDMVFGTNHLGHFLLTNLLLDVLLAAGDSRVVSVTSDVYRFAQIDPSDFNMTKKYKFFEGYCNSKLANVLFIKELARRLRDSGPTCYAIHPGMVDTEMFQNWPNYLRRMRPLIKIFMKSPMEGGQTSIYCAVADDIEKYSGGYFKNCRVSRTSQVANDPELARVLWEESARLCGLKKSTKFGVDIKKVDVYVDLNSSRTGSSSTV